MINETTLVEKTPIKETPTLWKWYFWWHPRIFLTVPIFLIFVYHGLWFVWVEIGDIIFFFQTTPVTWGSIFFVMFLGSIFLWAFIAPVFICFGSIGWLYEINTKNNTAWKKFLYSTGLILLVILGTPIIRIFTLWILGILR